MSTHRTQVGNLRMFYRLEGSGDPVVLMHGFPQTSYAWRKVIPALAERHTVLAPDLRGCGDTDRPATGYDKATVAADVHALVGQLGLGPVALVGHDVGMMVAYTYACAYPDDVARLVLADAALPGLGLGLEDLYDADANPRMYHLPLAEAPNGLAEALIAGREGVFVDHFMRQQAYDTDALADGALDEYARRLAAPGALTGGLNYFRAHHVDAERNRAAARTRLPMPVLSIGGSASFGGPLEAQVAPLVTDHRHVIIEECGHYLAEEKPERLADELLNFFAGRDRTEERDT